MWTEVYEFLGKCIDAGYKFLSDILYSLGAEGAIIITLSLSAVFAFRFIIQPLTGTSDMVKDLKKDRGRGK